MIAFSEVASGAFGIASAVSWGAGDFCGGVASKRASAYQVVIGSQIVGVLGLVALALAMREAVPPARNLLGCGAAGIAGAIGLIALYRALATGRMGVAAPISGVLSAALPVAAGAILQGLPRTLTLVGFALALVAVWLVARTDDVAIQLDDFGLPVVAGLGIGGFIILISRASGGAVLWPLVAARVASLAVLTAIFTAARQRLWPSRTDLPVVALAGIFDTSGNAFLVIAAHVGRLDVAAVLASLYPASTVLLAWWLLHERISRWQFAGLVATLAAIAAITA